MGQSLVKNYIHLVFSTKYREPLIDEAIVKTIWLVLICQEISEFWILFHFIMKFILEVKDHKVPFISELLGQFSYVKTKPLSGEKAEDIQSIQQAVLEMNEVKLGKRKARPIEDLLNEL